jgi:septal ring factor EnvC (AmiA/AmiB activator)
MRTDEEFADYHSRYNNDPVVQKLCQMIFDRTVIATMQDEIDVLENDLECMERELTEARYEIRQLESRTLSDMARELEQANTNQAHTIKAERERNTHLEGQIKALNDKINVWSILER